jgi:HSP20 family protein
MVSFEKGSARRTPLLAASALNWNLTILQSDWRPPTDVYETDDRYVVRVEIPGMRDGEFSVSVEENVLTIAGSRSEPAERRAYHQMEIHFGAFKTEIELPLNVALQSIQAEYEDGFLFVYLPKSQPKQIILGI